MAEGRGGVVKRFQYAFLLPCCQRNFFPSRLEFLRALQSKASAKVSFFEALDGNPWKFWDCK